MESDKLYRVQKEDLPKVEKMLNQCFAHDPLYETLIPDGIPIHLGYLIQALSQILHSFF